ncbi:uncharacterized protein LOC142012924 [Carettochelys insculpta]|uniref:uncharacterized protein LOC142012924 n=1 Tax=Carettochelys insculpta TaxID=44489 RepID=UPI003EBAD63B
MEAGKHEKYVLLNEDSDVEEFDKSKVALMHHPQDGKTCLKSSQAFLAHFHLRRLCHVFFILLLLTSQVFLSLFVLKLHQELETLKQKQVTTQKDDLQVFFYGADKNANGFLTFTEIEKVLGEDAPQKKELETFDEDNNKMYSYFELRKALELTGKKITYRFIVCLITLLEQASINVIRMNAHSSSVHTLVITVAIYCGIVREGDFLKCFTHFVST